MSIPSPLRRRESQPPPRSPVAVLLLLFTALIAGLTFASPAEAGSHSFADPIFSTDARGDIATIGNVTTTCDPTYANDQWSAAESAAACDGARTGATGLTRFDGAPLPPINNRLAMEYVDVDRDAGTFNSSTAELRIPAKSTVLWAGLHWNAATDVPEAAQLYGSSYEVAPKRTADRFQVRFATPGTGGYTTLSANAADGTTRDTWDDTNPGGTVSYGAFVDVTALVKAGGAGRYGVADVQSCRGFGGCFGSWSLTVAFANPTLPPRNLNVWHGWQLTSPSVDGGAQEFTVAGITPPPSGPVNARIGVVQADGDRGLGPDSLDISSPSHPTWSTFAVPDRPLATSEQDWFNSTVNTFGQRRPNSDSDPNHLANLNQDIALVQDRGIIGNDDTSFGFRVQTASSESLYSQVVHSAVDLYEPEIAVDKTVKPVGPVRTGHEVTWTLSVTNVGIDPIRRATVTDPLPAGLTFVPGSVRYIDGGPAPILGAKTDAPNDDQVDWNAADRTLSMRIGAGADGTSGGTMGLAPAADGSDRVTITYRTRVDAAPGSTTVNVAMAHGEGRELEDPFGPLLTDAEDPAEIATSPESDLGIAKTDDDAVVRKVGDRFTYGLTATNAGPSPATGVTMTDDLDDRLRFVDSDDGCSAVGQRVTCGVGALAVGAEATRTFVVEVVGLPGPGREIPNTATIAGDQHNPDCIEPTPTARCNHADELTPQPDIDLGIIKTDGDAVVRAVGDEYTYRLAVTNAGPDDATGVTITDALDPKIGFVASDDCTADGRNLTCEVGDLPAEATIEVSVTVQVIDLPEPGEAIPNVATVTGSEPDPDCTDETPDALCNEDDEQTPRPEDPAATTTTRTKPAPKGATPVEVRRTSGPLARTGSELMGVALVGLGTAVLGALVLIGRRRAAR